MSTRHLPLVLLATVLVACEPTIEPSPVPLTPDLVQATSSPMQIAITWRDNADNETSYRVEGRASDGTWDAVADRLPPNTTLVVHANVAHGVTYHYRVQACNEHGCSAYGEATGSWSDGEPPKIVAVIPGQPSARAIVLTALADGSGLPSTITFFVYQRDPYGAVAWSDPITARPATSVDEGLVGASFQVFGLQPNTRYEFFAIIDNAIGAGMSQREYFATVPEGPPSFQDGHTITHADGAASMYINIHPGGAETQYTFHLIPKGGSFAQPLVTTNGELPGYGSFEVAVGYSGPLQRGAEYQWRAIARNALGMVISDTFTFRSQE